MFCQFFPSYLAVSLFLIIFVAMKQKIIVAIDSFKGCLTSREANEAAAAAIKGRIEAGLASFASETEVIQMPVSDGGEGWTEAFRSAVGGETVELVVRDPLWRPVVAHYLVKDDTAVIEMAEASGLTLLKPEERNPMVATSYGTGQLIADAVRRGCRHVCVGLGGSATSDVGRGMLKGIEDQMDADHAATIHPFSDEVRYVVATDVTSPLYGPNGAAQLFAPQKGATAEQVEQLETISQETAMHNKAQMGYDCSGKPGAGAAGGLGYAFMQHFGSEVRPGAELLLDLLGFDRQIADADLIVTGEGSADRQTLLGKLPQRILERCKRQGKPTVLIAGKTSDGPTLLSSGFSAVRCVNPPGISEKEAMRKPVALRHIRKSLAELATSVVES